MNTQYELNEYIRGAWHQLEEAANHEDWHATQQAFRKMAKLQDLDEQSRNLQQQIAGLSDQVSSDGHSALSHQESPALLGQPGSARRGTIRPRELRVGAHHVPISINNQVLIATANWILKQGKTLPKIHNFVHPTNSGFGPSAQTRRLDDGSFIEIGDSQSTLIQKARKLLNACGFRELKLEVLLEDGTTKTA